MIFYVKDGSHVRLGHSVLCLHYRPETVHCSTKDAYTSEITIFALLYFGTGENSKYTGKDFEVHCKKRWKNRKTPKTYIHIPDGT